MKNEQTLLIDAVDKKTQESILLLNAKLRKLLEEINLKKDEAASGDPERASQLESLISEIAMAIGGIEGIVNVVVSEDLSLNEFIELNQAELEEFRNMILEGNKKIAQLEEKFAEL
ncbi:hypothetical protein ACFORL_06930 [Legionella dresdenensis]|uniref:Coiled-coil protein n=1 Tax=Legionella dresdenensis TaxID=450200 RepID=A0ABV8CFM3_9GAMM